MSIEKLIMNEEFYHVFQSIHNLQEREVLGYEVLLRSELYRNPEDIYSLAKKTRMLYELDSRSIHKAIQTYQYAGFSIKEGYLFLNILPSTLTNQAFPSFIKNIMNENLLSSQHFVFEIIEGEVIDNFSCIKEKVKQLKDLGVSIAIDDLGKGFSDFKRILEIKPDYIKLDGYFLKDLKTTKQKQEIVKFLVQFCETFGIKLIMEGVETQLDITISKKLGIIYGQGFALGKPK